MGEVRVTVFEEGRVIADTRIAPGGVAVSTCVPVGTVPIAPRDVARDIR
jgi:hypothetical protein